MVVAMQRRFTHKRVGPYELVRTLGRGGMGEVFLARASRAPDGSHVVIKTLHPELADRTEVLSMFAHEAQLGVQLSHPNIARVEEVGRDGEAPYLVMEWVPGPSLSEIISRFGRLPYAVVLRIVGDVAAALDHAHTAIGERGEPLNVVHRDVSPQNILVSVDGRVKLIDFGVARSEGQSHETETGVLKGKLSYMAPEQFRGRADHRVDLFSLGIVLHEALEGQRLFRRSTQAEVTAAILFEDIPPLTGPSIVRSTLQPIVDRALARNPDERYSSAAALRADVVVAMEQLGLECEDPDLAAIVQQAARERARDVTTTAPMPEWTAMAAVRVRDWDPPTRGLDDSQADDDPTVVDHRVRDVRDWTREESVALEAATTVEAATRVADRASVETPHGETAELPTRPAARSEPPTAIFGDRGAGRPARRHVVLGGALVIAVAVGALLAVPGGGDTEVPASSRVPDPPAVVVAEPTAAPRPTIAMDDTGQAPSEPDPSSSIEPPEADPPRRTRGRLWLATEPWSEVTVGGRSLGPTPIVGRPLPAGVYDVRLRDPGGRVHAHRIRIRAGRATKRFIRLGME